MQAFGDPHWEYHTTITKIWALLAAKLVDTPIIPFNATEYTTKLQDYLKAAKDKATQAQHSHLSSLNPSPSLQAADIHVDLDIGLDRFFAPLSTSLTRLATAAASFDAEAAHLQAAFDAGADRKIPWWKWWQRVKLYMRVRALNGKYKMLERQFLHAPGLDGRDWFKHVVFAPGLWTGYSGATYPGIVEAFEHGRADWESAARWVRIVEGKVEAAVRLLEG